MLSNHYPQDAEQVNMQPRPMERMRHILRFITLMLLVMTMAVTALVTSRAMASTTTVAIVGNTLTALPSCVKYGVKGMCFFLRCRLTGCVIVPSIRVEHYVPDAIISTYHDPVTHPWLEVGKPLSVAISSVGSTLLGAPIDSSASTQRESTEITTFKSADAIANPVGMIAQILTSGQIPNFSNVFGFPGYSELLDFPSKELPRIATEWTEVPEQLGNEFLEAARKMVKAPAKIISLIAQFPETLSKLTSGMGKLSDLFGGSSNMSEMASIGLKVVDLTGVDIGPVKDLLQVANALGADGAITDIFCPGASSAFTLHYQSDMDVLFWRNAIPVEMMYPQAWVPSLGEVSESPVKSTWGPIYPRSGEVVQSHPVKASAVLASRIGSIIIQSAQPHIYKRLQPGSGYKYFGNNGIAATQWQMLYPSAESSCHSFGTNDSVSLIGYGDFKTDTNDGYMWNMWNKYDCCRSRGSFLFSVP